MSRGRAAPSWAGHGDLAASAALVFPLVLVYGVITALTLRVHATDVVSRGLWSACGHDRQRYLLAYAAAAALYLLWLRRHGRGHTLRLQVVAPVVIEAAIYAFTMATLVWLAVMRAPGLGADTVAGAVGAGVHEELVFRLLGVAGGAALLRRLGVTPRTAVAIAAAIAAVLFAAAHGGDYQSRTFAFRCVAGLGFAAIFWQRSLAHAVYAHVLYDLWVAWR
jgi:hypothetical protein